MLFSIDSVWASRVRGRLWLSGGDINYSEPLKGTFRGNRCSNNSVEKFATPRYEKR